MIFEKGKQYIYKLPQSKTESAPEYFHIVEYQREDDDYIYGIKIKEGRGWSWSPQFSLRAFPYSKDYFIAEYKNEAPANIIQKYPEEFL